MGAVINIGLIFKILPVGPLSFTWLSLDVLSEGGLMNNKLETDICVASQCDFRGFSRRSAVLQLRRGLFTGCKAGL